MMVEDSVAELKPCPFCGGGTTMIREEGKIWLGKEWSQPVAIVVRHWCQGVINSGRLSRPIDIAGRDMDSAIAAWNRRC